MVEQYANIFFTDQFKLAYSYIELKMVKNIYGSSNSNTYFILYITLESPERHKLDF